jgi:hypothetical protein
MTADAYVIAAADGVYMYLHKRPFHQHVLRRLDERLRTPHVGMYL